MSMLLPSDLTDEFLLEVRMTYPEEAFGNLFDNENKGKYDKKVVVGYVKTNYKEIPETFVFNGWNYYAVVIYKTYGSACLIRIVGGEGPFDGYSPTEIAMAIQTGYLQDIEG